MSESHFMWLSQQELSQANAWNVLSIIDLILGINAVKSSVFQHLLRSRCPGSKIEYTTFRKHMFRHPQSWSPKNLTVCARLTKVLPLALKIEDLLYFLLRIFHPGQPSSPQKSCKDVNNMFSSWLNAGSVSAHPQFDSDKVHSRFGSEIQQIINLGKRNSFLLHVLAQLHFHVNSSVVQNSTYMLVQSI